MTCSRSWPVNCWTNAGRSCTIFCEVWFPSVVQRQPSSSPRVCTSGSPAAWTTSVELHHRTEDIDFTLGDIHKFLWKLVQCVVVPIALSVGISSIWHWGRYSAYRMRAAKWSACSQGFQYIVMAPVDSVFLSRQVFEVTASGQVCILGLSCCLVPVKEL